MGAGRDGSGRASRAKRWLGAPKGAPNRTLKGGPCDVSQVFDILTSAGGLVIVVVLVVAGGLLTWGHSFVNSNVHNQLAQQQIYFPPKAAFAHPKAGTEITPA